MSKFYTETIIKKKLVINYDSSPESPRACDNLGQFITVELGSYSPDIDEDLIDVVSDTAKDANNQEHHIELIKSELEDVRIVLPVSKYEHSGVKYYLSSSNSGGFDTSNCGFYIVFNESETHGDTTVLSDEELEEIISGELQIYTKFANGEVYGFLLHDDNGEIVDSCGGYYSIDDIKHVLPKEYADDDMREYLIY